MNSKHLKKIKKHFSLELMQKVSRHFYNNKTVFFILEVLVQCQQESKSGKLSQNECSVKMQCTIPQLVSSE